MLLYLVKVARDIWEKAFDSNNWQSLIAFWKGKCLMNYKFLITLLKQNYTWKTIKKTNITCHVKILVNVNHNQLLVCSQLESEFRYYGNVRMHLFFLYFRCALSSLDHHNDFVGVAPSLFVSHFDCSKITENIFYSPNEISKCNIEATNSGYYTYSVIGLVSTPLLEDYKCNKMHHSPWARKMVLWITWP